jgi:hypothetical protein
VLCVGVESIEKNIERGRLLAHGHSSKDEADKANKGFIRVTLGLPVI